MKAISENRRKIETEPHRHTVRRGITWGLHWENLPWLEAICRGVVKCSGLWARGLNNVLTVEMTETVLTLTRLPAAFDGFRILWISDIHVEPFAGLVERVLDLANGVDYDICVLGGDYCFNHVVTDVAVERMKVLAAGLAERSDVYGILGNHDRYAMGQVLDAAGVRVLLNEHVILERAGASAALVGVDDPHYYNAADLAAATAGLDGGCFTILLCHSPELYAEASTAGMDVFLAGHTHGGQVCLPGGFAPVTCTSVPRRFIKGVWHYEQLTGYTSRGAGASGIPVRFNCPAEVTRVTLRRGKLV